MLSKPISATAAMSRNRKTETQDYSLAIPQLLIMRAARVTKLNIAFTCVISRFSIDCEPDKVCDRDSPLLD